MISVRFQRQHVEGIVVHFFPYFNLEKETSLNNLAHKGVISDEYLSAITLNSVFDEIERLLAKKLMKTKGHEIKFDLSDAQASNLYRLFLRYPLHKDNIHLQMIRSTWILLLEKQLINNQLLRRSNYRPNAATSWNDYNED